VIGENLDDEKYEAKFKSIIWLFDSIAKTVAWLEKEKPKRPVHPKEIETYLLRGLYDDYCELSGNKTLSDAGPPIRFVRDCAKLIDPKMAVPKRLRQRLSYYDARNKSE
jgi:hypothetical protein